MMWQKRLALIVIIKEGVIRMNDEYPCDACDYKDSCDGWDAQFCCTLCMYLYGDNTPCNTCDPMDI